MQANDGLMNNRGPTNTKEKHESYKFAANMENIYFELQIRNDTYANSLVS